LLAQAKGQYADAEPLYKRSSAIYEKNFGSEHPVVARSLNNLATFYYSQGRYVEAEGLLKRALTIQEKALGSDHPDFAQYLNNLAFIHVKQNLALQHR
jgi:tetratricopeptide (TPR) repeat protein